MALPFSIKSELVLNQEQYEIAILEYLRRNGVNVTQIVHIDSRYNQKDQPEGVKVYVELGGTTIPMSPVYRATTDDDRMEGRNRT